MKRLKIAFFAMLGIIGYVSAAFTADASRQATRYHLEEDGSFSVALPNTYICTSTDTDVTCTYERVDTNLPISLDNSKRSETGVYTD